MNLSSAFEAALAILRREPSKILPFYLLGLAVPAMAQAIVIVSLSVSYAYLETNGRILRFRDELAALDRPPFGPDADAEALSAWIENLLPILELLFPPTVVAILAITAVIVVVFSFVAQAAVAAGQIGAGYGSVRSDRILVTGIAAVRRHWLGFLGARLLELALWIVLTVVAVAVVGAALTASPVAGLIVGFVTFWVWLLGVAVVRALFAFVPQAIVVDDAGVFGGLRGSWGFIRTHPSRALLYYAVAIGSLIAMGLALSATATIEAGSLLAPLGGLLLVPALDLTKIGLYAGHRGTASPPPSPDGGIGAPVVDGLKRGIREVSGFVRSAPGIHGIAVGLLIGGFAMGWLAAEPFAGVVQSSIAARLQGHVPPIAAARFFGNNWTVAVSMIFSGVAFALPAAVTLWFNGVVLGGYARLEADPVELTAFVLPHGVIELPAIAVGGALGLHLGRVAWRTWRGALGGEDFADALERSFWIAVGLGVILFVAALIEGFVSPYYYRLFL